MVETRTHTPKSLRHEIPDLYMLLKEASFFLRQSEFPVLTCAIAGHQQHQKESQLLSRAHLTQALAFVEGLTALSHTAYGIDVGQFLAPNHHQTLLRTGVMGKIISDDPWLRQIHQAAAPILRKGANIEQQLEETVSLIFDRQEQMKGKPVTTFHYAVGNALIKLLNEKGIDNIPVIHFVSDPYVHKNYLDYKNKKFVYYFTFDKQTAQELVKKGVPSERVFYIGFPLSQRLKTEKDEESLTNEYQFEPHKKIKVAVMTGGLGGYQDQMRMIAASLDYQEQQGIFYCSTNPKLAENLQKELGNKARIVDIAKEKLAIDPKDQAIIVVGDYLNTALINASYDILNICQVVCTKPSGDIGIEALLAGKLIVSMDPWGQHEKNILKVMEKMGAVLPVSDLLMTGQVITRLYRQSIFTSDDKSPINGLTKQALELQRNLNSPRNPFRGNWQEKAIKTLNYIRKLYMMK